MNILLLSLIFLSCAVSWARSPIPYPFYAEQAGGQNKLRIIEDGIGALQLRVEMIRRAKSTIDVEYFIFNHDTAGKIMLQELVAAAERGVRVRILVDKSFAVFELDYKFAQMLRKYKIDLRYYNPAHIYQISTVQFRNHRKLLAVDDREALTGGRNIGDDYFDLSPEFNFNDRDIFVEGPMVKVLRESFDKFFANPTSERPDAKTYVSKEDANIARDILKSDAKEKATRKRMDLYGRVYLAQTKSYVCPVTTFASDAPGAGLYQRLRDSYGEKFRHLRVVLNKKILAVDKRLIISSPYMIHNKRSRLLMDQLIAKKIKIHVYTNSLGSTDAFYVAANLYLGMQEWIDHGVKVYLHDGKFAGLNPNTPVAVKKARWGTHAKSMVYESQNSSEIMVGTYNVDNRSNFYNTEMAIFCQGNTALTQELKQNIVALTKKALVVHSNGTATDSSGAIRNVYGASEKEIKKMKWATIPSWLASFLL